MTIFQSLLLGVIEGLTEFIPVSSTAHMLVAQKLLSIPASDGMFSFLILVQIGPLIALLIYFWSDLLSLAKAFFAPPFSTPENKTAWFVIIATIPALIAGLLLKTVVQGLFQTPLLEAAIRFFAAAILLVLAEWFGRQNRKLDSMTWMDALIIGTFQVFAIFPGSSRSGSVISGGMLRQFDRASATRFAFLMSAPVMIAAATYEMLDLRGAAHLGSILPSIVVGLAVAAIVGWLAIRWLITYVSKNSLYGFAIYCSVFGTILLIFYVYSLGLH